MISRSIHHDKIVNCIKRLPDSIVGHQLYSSLQTMILKGNNYTMEEEVVYGQFLSLLTTALDTAFTDAHMESHLDACHDYLVTKIRMLEGRSPRNGKISCYTAESPNGKRFKFGSPVYRPPKTDEDFYDPNKKDPL